MYRNLLVPIDGNELTPRAIRKSVALARQLGAKITGFIAEPPATVPAASRSAAAIAAGLDEHDARTVRHASGVLRRFEDAARRAGVEFEGHYAQATQVGEAIVAAAREHGCDLIVMATHGRGLLGQLLHGSQTKAVLARSALPLLVLH